MFRKASLIALLLAGACGGAAEEGTANEQSAASAAPTEGTIQASDGLTISYDTRGQGETTLLFVHCWACDREFWREQLDAFADDYRVVSVDLAGHGASGKQREEWTLDGLAADLETLVRKLGLHRVILVGHSMGGPVSLLAAARLPERVIGVVAVDTLHNAEYVWPPEAVEQMVGQFEADYEGTMADMVLNMFPEGADQELQQWVIAKAAALEPGPVLALMRDFGRLDLKEAFSAVQVPVRAVNAVPWQPQGFETAVEVNQKYADFDAVTMEGVGHYLHLERPAEFNSRLREVVRSME